MKNQPILKKIQIFNQTISDVISEGNSSAIIKHATDRSVEIFGADFGLALGQFNHYEESKISYKTTGTPENPVIPRENGVNNIIIPVHYSNHAFGSIVLYFNEPHTFTEEDELLSSMIGNTIAQAVTINWLVENESQALVLAERQKETEVLLEQEKLKTEFIANATHEFRTPLAIIRGNIDLALLENSKIDKSMKKLFKDINHEVEHLSSMISDLVLITSKDPKMKSDLTFHELNLSSTIAETVKRCVVIAAKRKITIRIKKLQKNIPLNGNKTYLEKLLTNLIRNAITYGKDGGSILIDAQKKGDMVEVSVKDNGIGISEEDLPHIFERFYRVDKSHSTDIKNTGLGLAISKWIVSIHKGTLHVQSMKGKGTTFTFSLPVLK
jgi:signal transduction histidine kinase